MRLSKKYAAFFTTAFLLTAAAAQAARVDMTDPRRALGREDDVRIDAQLVRDTVSPSNPIAVTYQVQNLSSGWIAIADKVCSTDYDADSRTITLSVGAEVPTDGTMPHMVVIAPGEKKTFSTGAAPRVVTPAGRSPFSLYPRFVQVKVSLLRDLTPFKELLAHQTAAAPQKPERLTDAQFDAWMQSNDSVLLNAIPIQWNTTGSRIGGTGADAAQPVDIQSPNF